MPRMTGLGNHTRTTPGVTRPVTGRGAKRGCKSGEEAEVQRGWTMCPPRHRASAAEASSLSEVVPPLTQSLSGSLRHSVCLTHARMHAAPWHPQAIKEAASDKLQVTLYSLSRMSGGMLGRGQPLGRRAREGALAGGVEGTPLVPACPGCGARTAPGAGGPRSHRCPCNRPSQQVLQPAVTGYWCDPPAGPGEVGGGSTWGRQEMQMERDEGDGSATRKGGPANHPLPGC